MSYCIFHVSPLTAQQETVWTLLNVYFVLEPCGYKGRSGGTTLLKVFTPNTHYHPHKGICQNTQNSAVFAALSHLSAESWNSLWQCEDYLEIIIVYMITEAASTDTASSTFPGWFLILSKWRDCETFSKLIEADLSFERRGRAGGWKI